MELQNLEGLLSDLLAGKSGRFCLLVGEAGVGKSTLLQHFRVGMESKTGLTVLDCECEQTQQSPFFPLVKAIAHYMDSSNSEGTRGRLRTVLSETFGDALSLVPGLGNAGGIITKIQSVQQEGYLPQFLNYESRAVVAFARFFTGLADAHPLVLLVDDLQWSDGDTIGLLHYLAELMAGHRILIVATLRAESLAELPPEAPARLLTSDLLRSRRGVRIDLPRLPKEDTGPVVQRFLGPHALSRKELDLLYEETEGNPFFLREMLFLLLDRGELQRREGVVVASANLPSAVVPETVKEAIRERVQKLPPEFRRTLDAASVVGSVFDSNTVSCAIDGKAFEVLERLRDLERIYSLVERLNGNHRFYHVKIQETLYDDLPLDLRRLYHRAIGEVLSKRGDRVLHEVAGDHFRDAGLVREAHSQYELARRAFSSSENWGGLERVTTKLLQLPPEVANLEGLGPRQEVHLARAVACYHLGKYRESRSDAEAAILGASTPWQILVEASHLVGRASYFLGLRDECFEAYNKSLSQAEAAGDWKMVFRNHMSLAAACDLFGDYRGMEKHFATAGETAEAHQDRKAWAEVLMKSGMIIMDEPPKVIPQISEALRLYTEVGDARGVAAAHLNMGNEYFYQRDLDRAEEHYSRSLATLRESGGVERCYPLNNLAMVYQVRGDFHKARGVLQEALAWHLTEYHRIFVLNNTANTLRLLGAYVDAIELLAGLLPAVALDRDPVTPETTFYNLGMAHLYAQHFQEAADWLEKSFSQRTKSNADLNRGKRWKALARAYHGLGNLAKEEHCARKAEELLASDVPDVWYYRDIDWEVADLAFYE